MREMRICDLRSRLLLLCLTGCAGAAPSPVAPPAPTIASVAVAVSEESTDDAVVEARFTNVEARTSGKVAAVSVQDNERVEAGAVLVEIDDHDAKSRKLTADTELATAQSKLAALRAGGTVLRASPPVAAAEAERNRAELDLRRSEQLRSLAELSQAEVDARRAEYDRSVAALAKARARDNGRPIAVKAGPEDIAVAEARVRVAEAKVEQAALEVSYTRIKAPIAGVVTRLSVEVGQTVDTSHPLMSISGLEDAWIVALYKEDRIAHIRPGQHVAIDVVGRRGGPLAGHVDRVSGGAVVIRIDDKPRDFALLPGMRTHVTVKTEPGD